MESSDAYQAAPQSGFTLIELSIVLVIIGLITGGILVGRDLIKAAQIRATVTQLEKYNAAANTFLNKYNGVPGDLANPTSFFPSVIDSTGAIGGIAQGNGNGQIESLMWIDTLCLTAMCVSGEAALFWYELSQANLIPDYIANADIGDVLSDPTAIISVAIPTAQLGRGNYIAVNSANAANGGNRLNYFIIGRIAGGHGGAPNWQAGLTPMEAYQIDSKIDDGLPTTGIVLSLYNPNAWGGAALPINEPSNNGVAPDTCYNAGASPAVYSTSSATQDIVVCLLSVRTSF